jgi:hypothetical protein
MLYRSKKIIWPWCFPRGVGKREAVYVNNNILMLVGETKAVMAAEYHAWASPSSALPGKR